MKRASVSAASSQRRPRPKRKQQPRKKNGNNNNGSRRGGSINQLIAVPQITECTKGYLAARMNPCRTISPLPCIPDVIVIPSNKFRTRALGAFVTNAAGQGLIGVAPYRTYRNNSAGANDYPVWTSSLIYAPSLGADFGLAVLNAPTGVNMTGPYSIADLNVQSTQLRLVGCGVQVYYEGTVFNKGGRMCLYRSPANIGIQSGTINTLMAIPATRVTPITTEWRGVVYEPDDPDFLGYQQTATLEAANVDRTAVLLIVVTGLPVSTSFEFEVSSYWEMIGSLTIGNTNYTKAHSDVVGMSAVNSIQPTKISDKPMAQTEKKGLADLGQEIVSGLSHVAYVMGKRAIDSYTQPMAIMPSKPVVTDAD